VSDLSRAIRICTIGTGRRGCSRFWILLGVAISILIMIAWMLGG